LFPDYVTSDPFLEQFLFPGTYALPCLHAPKDDGPYLTAIPAAISDTGDPFEPSVASFDGSFRIPHHAVRLIADSSDNKLLGFLDRSSSPPSQE
jgi:hypothetical protein